MEHEFTASDYLDFKRRYLLSEAGRLLDKTPAPRVSGELSGRASDINIRNAEALNRWAAGIANKAQKLVDRLKLDARVETARLDDWRQGGASFVRVYYRTELDPTHREIVVRIMDSNNIKINFPPTLGISLGFGRSEQTFRSHGARDAAIKLLSTLLKGVADDNNPK